jgi:hypothetical protein
LTRSIRYLAMSLGSRTLGTCLDNQIDALVAPQGGFVGPTSMFQVSVVTFPILAPRPGTTVVFVAFSVDLNTTAYERTERGVLRPRGVVAIDGAEIVPEGAVGWLRVVLNLDDACGGDIVVGEVTELERNTGTNFLGVDDAVDGALGFAGDDVACVVFAAALRWSVSKVNLLSGIATVFEESKITVKLFQG